ncbi:MAG: phosphate signaling complex protein PhoU [Luteolibacter sp.]
MDSAPHILKDFDNSLTSLKDDVLSMAARTRHNLERAIQSLMERNKELANSVIADDDDVDEYERSIDKMGMGMLLKYQPIATDLRLIVSSMKISSNLERISDHATSIAKRAKKIMKTSELLDARLIEPLYTLADQLLRDAIAAYSDGDAALGASLHARDKELDKLHHEVTANYGERLEEPSGRSQEYLHLIFVVRSLERVGDLASNIGEDAVYVRHASDVRHLSKSDRQILGEA